MALYRRKFRLQYLAIDRFDHLNNDLHTLLGVRSLCLAVAASRRCRLEFALPRCNVSGCRNHSRLPSKVNVGLFYFARLGALMCIGAQRNKHDSSHPHTDCVKKTKPTATLRAHGTRRVAVSSSNRALGVVHAKESRLRVPVVVNVSAHHLTLLSVLPHTVADKRRLGADSRYGAR